MFQCLSLNSDSLKREAKAEHKKGELVPAGRIRSRAQGIDMLFDFLKNAVMTSPIIRAAHLILFAKRFWLVADIVSFI